MSLPKMKKELLRQASYLALVDRGGTVAFVNGPGIVQGARLKIEKSGAEPKTVAVRTSLDREVGLLRHRSGENWQTISKVDEVVVAVPHAEDASQIEVLGFDPNVLSAAFDAAAAGQERTPNGHKAPFFVSLDRQYKTPAGKILRPLKDQASWHHDLAIERLARQKPASLSPAARLIDQFKRDLLAELNASDIRLEITVVK